ncbi:MAG: hypothetical protein LPH21_12955 [Shewanella sp.]|nr:hypothetical protein [Shewanella sp.]
MIHLYDERVMVAGFGVNIAPAPYHTATASTGFGMSFKPHPDYHVASVSSEFKLAGESEVYEFAALVSLYKTSGYLGGILTSPVATQTPTPLKPIQGVTLIQSLANQVGVGHLTIKDVGGKLEISWAGRGAGTPVARGMVSSGLVELVHAEGVESGSLLIDLDFQKAVPGVYPIDITNNRNTINHSITEAQSANGVTRYYGLVLRNDNPSITYTQVSARTLFQPVSGVEFYLGVDPAGVTIASQSDAPAGVTFAQAADIPALAPGESVALWLKLISLAGVNQPMSIDLNRVIIEAKP